MRSSRQVPRVYFGRPGSMVSLPWPRGDMDQPYGKQVFEFVTGGGQYQVSSLASGARQISLKWNALHVDTFDLVDQYWANGLGTGPWAFHNPSSPNMLLPNQASATNSLYDVTGFSTSDGLADMGTLLSNTDLTKVQRTGGQRSLRWQFTVTANSFPVLQLKAPYRNWFGYPVVPTLPYIWSLYARPDGVVDSSITMAAKFQWLDATGTQIGSDVSGGDIVMTGSTLLSATATAPSGAAYLKPLCVATGSTITTGASIYIDTCLLEQDTVVNPWAQGTGSRPVEMTSWSDTAPFDARFRLSPNLILRELAA